MIGGALGRGGMSESGIRRLNVKDMRGLVMDGSGFMLCFHDTFELLDML